MSRQDAIQLLYAASGTRTPEQLADWLQDAGLVSDNVIEPRRIATVDLLRAAAPVPAPAPGEAISAEKEFDSAL